MRRLLRAEEVMTCLDVCDQQKQKINECYEDIKASLIKTIRDIHPNQECEHDKYLKIAQFMSRFDTVLSLNYDLLVYWSMMKNNDPPTSSVQFKDCFINNSEFHIQWDELREVCEKDKKSGKDKVTLVFYPHGNLALIKDKEETEKKVKYNRAEKIIDQLSDIWKESIPLFVSEGSAKLKEKSIKSSNYLNIVNNQVIPSLKGNVVIYGSSLEDKHIFNKIGGNKHIKKIAISVFKGDEEVKNKAKEIFEDQKDKEDLIFFDAESEGIWD